MTRGRVQGEAGRLPGWVARAMLASLIALPVALLSPAAVWSQEATTPKPQAQPPQKSKAKPATAPPKKAAARPKKRTEQRVSPPAAQTSPGDGSRSAPPQTADCAIDAVGETGPVTYTVPIPVPGSKRRLAECMMPASRAVALLNKGSLFVVDTRRESDFAQYRIPGSLNIPLPFVKTKGFLKEHAFVLVNEGHTSAPLEQACKDLRAAGFKKASVVQGGLLGWAAAKGTIEGDLIAQRRLTRMSPAEFAQEGAYGDWLVASVARVPDEELQKFLPKAVALPNAQDGARFASALQAAVAKHTRKGVALKVLVVDDDGSRAEKLEALLPAELASPVLFLEGGLAGYRKFWTEQAAIWASAEREPRRPRCGA